MDNARSTQSHVEMKDCHAQLEDRNDSVVNKRLSVIKLAERLGNVSEACRRSGVNRTSFYQWKKRFISNGVEGLKQKKPVHKRHPNTTPKEIVEELLMLSLKHPRWGCVRIAEHLKKGGVSISSPTVQKILANHGMGTLRDRIAPRYEGYEEKRKV